LKSSQEDAVELQQIQKTFNEFAEQVQRTLGQLRRVDQERSELTATLTHELRTPLTSVRGYAQLVREGDAGPLSGDQAKFLDLVIQGCDRLNRLVDQVLEVEKKEAEVAWSSESSLAPVDLPALLQECVEVVSPLARERAVAIELELQPVSGFVSDSFRLRQVFLNLISNAVKYNRLGGSVWIRSLPGGSSEWQIEVEDTGLGLTESERKALFKKFYRTEEAKGSGAQGSGLGLYITQKWVESLGGRIEVQSEKGVGTRFCVILPHSTPSPHVRTG
jgi:signal transduction histidine kinase